MMPSGKLVRLRAFEPSDAEALHRWNHDPFVSRWMVNSYPMSVAQLRKWIDDRPKNSYQELVLVIETLADATPIGAVALTGADPEPGWAELAIYLGEEQFRGGGYGTDAMRVICRYGFDAMRLHGIFLWVVEENAGARRVYEKVGFVTEGRHRERFLRDGTWHDAVAMSLLNGELRD